MFVSSIFDKNQRNLILVSAWKKGTMIFDNKICKKIVTLSLFVFDTYVRVQGNNQFWMQFWFMISNPLLYFSDHHNDQVILQFINI